MLLKFRQKVFNWFQSSNYENSSIASASNSPNAVVRNPSSMRAKGLTFKVMYGSGGTVIETIGEYDRMKDENIVTLHVIPDGGNLAEALSHIITLQTLRG